MILRSLMLMLLAVAAACAVDVTGPAECRNALMPPTFRLVLTSGDTLPRVVNRYLDPHRSADTIFVTFANGAVMRVIDTRAAGYCVTAFDSVVFRTANARTWVE